MYLQICIGGQQEKYLALDFLEQNSALSRHKWCKKPRNENLIYFLVKSENRKPSGNCYRQRETSCPLTYVDRISKNAKLSTKKNSQKWQNKKHWKCLSNCIAELSKFIRREKSFGNIGQTLLFANIINIYLYIFSNQYWRKKIGEKMLLTHSELVNF
jgi:hypothetical protein